MTYQEPGGEYTRGDFARLKMIAGMCHRSVLDVGAGKGFLRLFLPETISYVGIDENPSDEVKIGSVYNTGFHDRSFDTVVLSEVLEHLERPLDALIEMRRVTIGKLIISVPNPYNLDQIASVFRNGYNIQNPNHINLFGDNEIRSLCCAAGFNNVQMIPFYTKIPLLNWLSPIKSHFGEWSIYEVW
jgi:SAM-dependent methyltransferase